MVVYVAKWLIFKHINIFHPSLNSKDHFDIIPKGYRPNWHIWKVSDQINISVKVKDEICSLP